MAKGRVRGEIKNNSRKPRDITKNRHNGSLKKGQHTLRISVSEDRVTATLCTEELFLRTQYIWLSSHIRQVQMCRGGRTRTVNTTHRAVPDGFHSSKLVLHAIKRVLDVHKFLYNYFVTGEDK
jgi:hypothetical protein